MRICAEEGVFHAHLLSNIELWRTGGTALWFWTWCVRSDVFTPAPISLGTLLDSCAHSNLATDAEKRGAVYALALLDKLFSRCARSDLAAHAPASMRTFWLHCERPGLAAHALRNHERAFPPIWQDSILGRIKYKQHISLGMLAK